MEEYDDLNRMKRTLQDVGGIDVEIQYSYDAMGNLTEVIDPKGLSTTYEYDARGNLTELDSPDTGTTTYIYDAADNRISQTDARSVTTDYTYDALNRLTKIEYPDSSLDVSFEYGEGNTSCPNSYYEGRLTSMTDASGTTLYCYDHRGNIIQKLWNSNIGSVSVSVIYEYDLADRLAAVIYPSGDKVEMTRNTAGRLTELAVDGGPTLVSNIEYLPLGPAGEYTFGNSEVLTKTRDQNYWTTDVTSPAMGLHFRRDATGNIDRLGTAPGATTPLEEYGYDNLYRLEDIEDGSSSLVESYTYDATGNRTSKETPKGIEPYVYSAGSHRLQSVKRDNRGYDAVGNTISNAGNAGSYTYDDRNRLVDFSSPKGSGIYQYNGRGERVYKNSPSVGLVFFVYDEAGRLLGEYDLFGTPLREYFHADDTPVAIIEPDDSVYYIHTDHLGTPRAVTDQTGTKRWEWAFQGNPFGEQEPDEDPDSTGTDFVLNLRFPGQYYDAESGLHYNYFRDYEPDTGRYIEGDPIGQLSGVSMYSYVHNNPLIYIDSSGMIAECTEFSRRIGPWKKKEKRIKEWSYYDIRAVSLADIGVPAYAITCICRRESATEISYVAEYEFTKMCRDTCTGEISINTRTGPKKRDGEASDPDIQYKNIGLGIKTSEGAAELECRDKCMALN